MMVEEQEDLAPTRRIVFSRDLIGRERLMEIAAICSTLGVVLLVFVCAWFSRPDKVKSVHGLVSWMATGMATSASSASGSPGEAAEGPVPNIILSPSHFGCEKVTNESFDECLERRLGQEIMWRSLKPVYKDNIVMFQLYSQRPLLISRKTGPKQL